LASRATRRLGVVLVLVAALLAAPQAGVTPPAAAEDCLVERDGQCAVAYPAGAQQLINQLLDEAGNLGDSPLVAQTKALAEQLASEIYDIQIEDPDELVRALRQFVDETAPELVEVGPLVDQVRQTVDELAAEVVRLLQEIVERFLQQTLPQLIRLAMEAIEGTGPTVEALRQLVVELLAYLTDKLDQLIADAGPLVDESVLRAAALVAAARESAEWTLADALDTAGQVVNETVPGTIGTAEETADQARDQAAATIDEARDEAVSAVEQIVDPLPGLVDGVVGTGVGAIGTGTRSPLIAPSALIAEHGYLRVRLRWAAPSAPASAVEGYLIQLYPVARYGDRGAPATPVGAQGTRVCADCRDITIINLRDGGFWEVGVFAVYAGGVLSGHATPDTFAAGSTSYPLPAPGAPSVSATTVGSTAARVSILASDGVPASDVVVNAYRLADGAFIAQQVAPASNSWQPPEVLFQGLAAGSQYYFDVVARNASGVSLPGRSNTLTAGALPPSSPVSLVAWPKQGAALVEWDPPVPGVGHITQYLFEAIDIANDGSRIARAVTGRHTSTLVSLPAIYVPSDPVVLDEVEVTAPRARAYRFCVTAATDGGYGSAACTTDPLTSPVIGPSEPPPCTFLTSDEVLTAAMPSDSDDGSSGPVTLGDRLDVGTLAASVEERLGSRFAGVWGDFSVTPSGLCVSAVGLTPADIAAIRSTATGPIDRVAFHVATYSRDQLVAYQDAIGGAFDAAGEADYSLSLREDMNAIQVARHSPSAAGTAALATSAPPAAIRLQLASADDRQSPRNHSDPREERDYLPPYRAGLRVSNFSCALAFTMRNPSGTSLSGSTAGHCFPLNNRPPRGSVQVRQFEIGREARNTYREARDGTDFANVALDTGTEARAEVIVNETANGSPIVRDVTEVMTPQQFIRGETNLCISAAFTRECGVVLVTNRTYTGGSDDHLYKEMVCIAVHTEDGDSGAPVYQRRSPGSRLLALAAGWESTGGPSCFVMASTVERDQQLRPLTTP
jgi:hypothetical protein